MRQISRHDKRLKLLHWSRHVLYCLANLNHAKTFFDHFTGELSGLPWIKSDLLQIKPRRYASQIILIASKSITSPSVSVSNPSEWYCLYKALLPSSISRTRFSGA